MTLPPACSSVAGVSSSSLAVVSSSSLAGVSSGAATLQVPHSWEQQERLHSYYTSMLQFYIQQASCDPYLRAPERLVLAGRYRELLRRAELLHRMDREAYSAPATRQPGRRRRSLSDQEEEGESWRGSSEQLWLFTDEDMELMEAVPGILEEAADMGFLLS